MSRPRVLMLTNDVVGPEMAGPAIRTVELARVLTSVAEVVVASAHPPAGPVDLPDVVVAGFHAGGVPLEAMVAGADVVVGMTAILHEQAWLCDAEVVVVADAYDPALFETLSWFSEAPPGEREARADDARARMVEPLAWADHVLAASTRQRHLLIGVLTALGRINPATYGADPTLEVLVPVVPFGLPSTPPTPGRARPLRRPVGPFTPDDFVLLWGGGVYEWLDPLTLVDAVAAVDDETVKTFVLAGPHPTPSVPVMPMRERLVGRARNRGLLGTRVVVADRWVPYGERGALLLDADVGVTLHPAHLETEFAFRTRILDYVWAGLPILCSSGDALSAEVARRGAGVVVAPADVSGVVDAIRRLRSVEVRVEAGEALRRWAEELSWAQAAAPLVELCAAPRRAPDRPHGPSPRTARSGGGLRERLSRLLH